MEQAQYSPMASNAAATQSLEAISQQDVPNSHPVAILSRVYEEVKHQLFGAHLPSFEAISERCPESLMDFCLVLEPIQGEPYIDYLVTSRGRRISVDRKYEHKPRDADDMPDNNRYSQTVEPDTLAERLMEMTSAIVLREHQLSSALSARHSRLNMRVFRGIFPVFMDSKQKAAVILLVAPTYSIVE